MLPLSAELMDTFRTLSVKKRQGVLEIISPQREYELTFYEGKIIHADRIDKSFIQFLSDNIVSKTNLMSSDLDSVGRGEQITRLLQITDLDLSKLIELKKAYDRETLSVLAEESHFSFDFRTKIVRCPEGLSLELSPGHYLLDLIEEQNAEEGNTEARPATLATEPNSFEIEPAVPELSSAAISSAEKYGRSAVSIIQPVSPEPQIAPASPVKRKRRKHRKPPRAGRFKASKQTEKPFLTALKLGPEQTLMGIKLTLILLLSLFAPGYLSDWSLELYSFLSL